MRPPSQSTSYSPRSPSYSPVSPSYSPATHASPSPQLSPLNAPQPRPQSPPGIVPPLRIRIPPANQLVNGSVSGEGFPPIYRRRKLTPYPRNHPIGSAEEAWQRFSRNGWRELDEDGVSQKGENKIDRK